MGLQKKQGFLRERKKKKSYNKFKRLYGSSGPNLMFDLKCDWLDWNFFFFFWHWTAQISRKWNFFQISFGPLPNVVLKLIQNCNFWNAVSVLRRRSTGFRIPYDFYVILNQLFSSTVLGKGAGRVRQTKTNLERRLLRRRQHCVNTIQYTFVIVCLPCASVQDCDHFTLESNIGRFIGGFPTWTVLLCSDTDDWFQINQFAYFPWVALRAEAHTLH